MSEERERGERRDARDTISDGLRQGLGILSAFKDALEETIQEARERGDLSSDRAREVMREAMGRAQEAAGEARERLDLVPRREFDALRDRVEELGVRLENLERRASQAGGAGEPGPAGEPPPPPPGGGEGASAP